jgi:teichoic acid transport system permease protein
LSSLSANNAGGFNPVALAESAKLTKVGTRPRLFSYLRDFYQRRAFANTLARYSLQASTAKSSLGAAWHVVVPALQIGVYGVIFGVLLSSIRPANFVPYLITGIVLFQFITGCITDGAKSITANASLVRSLDFPRILLPVSAVISNLLKVLPLIGIMIVGLLLLGERPNLGWFLLIPDLILMILFSAGTAMITARLTVHLDDLNQLLPFIVRVLFYTSGIFWNIDKMIHIEWLKLLLHYNPIHLFLVIARSSLVSGYTSTALDWVAAAAWSVAILLLGVVFFWLAEEKYGRNV